MPFPNRGVRPAHSGYAQNLAEALSNGLKGVAVKQGGLYDDEPLESVVISNDTAKVRFVDDDNGSDGVEMAQPAAFILVKRT